MSQKMDVADWLPLIESGASLALSLGGEIASMISRARAGQRPTQGDMARARAFMDAQRLLAHVQLEADAAAEAAEAAAGKEDVST